jgi:hypothetical protein
MNTATLIQHLALHDDVDAVFITGSHGQKSANAQSDIDLVIILQHNAHNIRSVYQWIDNTFADIFFFDHADLERIGSATTINWNDFDGMFISWLQKSTIEFDKSGQLTRLKEKVQGHKPAGVIAFEKRAFWQKVNYNLVANTRYFQSTDPLYHEALELRLGYSVIEVICAYLAFQNEPWRGEKHALRFLRQHAPEMYKHFQEYTQATSLRERFTAYTYLAHSIFTNEYPQWTIADRITITKDQTVCLPTDPASNHIEKLFG